MQNQCYECTKSLMVDFTNDVKLPYSSVRMILCPDCGNKRCPKATDHRNDCTNSNEPGQKGSRYV